MKKTVLLILTTFLIIDISIAQSNGSDSLEDFLDKYSIYESAILKCYSPPIDRVSKDYIEINQNNNLFIKVGTYNIVESSTQYVEINLLLPIYSKGLPVELKGYRANSTNYSFDENAMIIKRQVLDVYEDFYCKLKLTRK